MKRGVSPIIATVLLVGLAVVLVGVVWAIVNGLVQDQTQQASACFGNFDKVVLNEDYTCYNEGTLQVSIDVKDIDVESIIVSIETDDETKTFELSNDPLPAESGVISASEKGVIIPSKNSGRTYLVDSSFFDPEGLGIRAKKIKISPKIKGYQCEVSSTISQIGDC